MAAWHYYHMLSTLLITNRLFPVYTETILGEKVNEEFDFDGLPGVRHEFKVNVPPGGEECFFQFVPLNAKLYVYFKVIRGGDRDINFNLIDPGSMVVSAQYNTADGRTVETAAVPGHYQLCFDNTLTSFGSRLVLVSLETVVMEEWNKYLDELAELKELAVNFTAILAGVELSLIDVSHFQTNTRMNVIRDWYLITGNKKYVGYWSVAQCVIVIFVGFGQVFFLRRLFTVPKVTPTSKPRA